jgi:hypothetical protein
MAIGEKIAVGFGVLLTLVAGAAGCAAPAGEGDDVAQTSQALCANGPNATIALGPTGVPITKIGTPTGGLYDCNSMFIVDVEQTNGRSFDVDAYYSDALITTEQQCAQTYVSAFLSGYQPIGVIDGSGNIIPPGWKTLASAAPVYGKWTQKIVNGEPAGYACHLLIHFEAPGGVRYSKFRVQTGTWAPGGARTVGVRVTSE